ncbi:hypothetical protein S83_035371, partial [Arachis hypogaea]
TDEVINTQLMVSRGDHIVKIIDCEIGSCVKVLGGHRRTPWVEVMGQELSHEGVNSEHISYDHYEQEEEKHEEVDVDYMDEDDTN